MKLETWTPALLAPVVRFWNRSFASRRNFFPVTAEDFRVRVVDKSTAVERFDPKGFIVARNGKDVVGMVHVGSRPEAMCRALEPAWPGGAQGYVAFLFVDPAWRRKGVGTELWHRGLEALKETRQVTVDGQCLNPFYGNSEGPFTPLWGTPEGVGVDWEDSPTKKFLARKGFAPRFRAIHLARNLSGAELADWESVRKATARQEFELGTLEGEYPELGRPPRERRPTAGGPGYEVVTAVRGGKIAGLLSFYPQAEVRPGQWAIYEAMVIEELRGRTLGRRLLEGALARIRARGGDSVEVLTLPELSPAALRLYLAAGFTQACSWAVY